MKNDKSLQIGIISSVIGSIIFLYFLGPILDLLGRLFIFLSKNISSYFIDSLYQEIAVGKTDYSFTIMLCFIVLVGFATTIFLLRHIDKPEKNIEIDVNKEETDIKEHKKRNKIIDLMNGKIFIVSFICVIWIILILQFVASSIKVSAINKFEQDIKILTPYMEPTQKDKIVSRFCSMKSYTDYKNIILEINGIAEKNNIDLPSQKYAYLY
jgi:hypothetical protein